MNHRRADDQSGLQPSICRLSQERPGAPDIVKRPRDEHRGDGHSDWKEISAWNDPADLCHARGNPRATRRQCRRGWRQLLHLTLAMRAAAELRLYEARRQQRTVPGHFTHAGRPSHVLLLARVCGRSLRQARTTPGAWPAAGESIDAAIELLDPWARAVSDACWDRRATIAGQAQRQELARDRHAARRRVGRPRRSSLRDPSDIVIYEMHVGGFTRHPSSGVRHPGTFAGLIEKIPYLKELGVTHVELLPVMAFDEQDIPPGAVARGLKNYWGYSTCGFYAPHPRYCIDAARAPQEFRDCVRALHDAGIGVLLDVVFNHTAEGGDDRADDQFQGACERRLLPSRIVRPASLSRLHRLRQHRQLQSSVGDELHSALPGILDRVLRRGWLSLRPCERIHARRGRRAARQSSAHVGHRVVAHPREAAR